MTKIMSRWMIGVFLLSAVLIAAACSDSGQITPEVDGDEENLPDYPTDTPCIDDDGCPTGQRCMENPDGSGTYCFAWSCTDTTECQDLGPGCYCQGDHCECPGGGDIEALDPTDGDGKEIDDSSTSGFYADPAEVNFGAVQRTFRAEKKLNLCNGGDGLLILNGVQFKAGRDHEPNLEEFGLVGDIPSASNNITLAPGDCHEITVTYIPDNPGADDAFLTVGTNIALEEVYLYSEVKGEPEISVVCEELANDGDDSVYSFGPVIVNQTAVMNCRLVNVRQGDADNAVLIIKQVVLEDPLDQHYQIDEASLNTSSDHNGEIWLSPDDDESFNLIYHPRNKEVHRIDLHVYHNDETNDDPFVTSFIGAGCTPEMVLNPFPSMKFGNVPAGECKSQLLKFTNTGCGILEVREVQLQENTGQAAEVWNLDIDWDVDGQNNVPTELPNWESTEIEVSCCPQGRDAYANIIEIISNSLGLDPNYTYLPVTCTGVIPYCEIYPQFLEFGSIYVDDSAEREIRIANNGQATAVIENMMITGSALFEFVEPFFFPIELPPGSQMIVTVRFTPTDQATYQGTLVITPREGDCEVTEIPLTGIGIAPLLEGPQDCLEWINAQVVPDEIPEGQEDIWRESKEIVLRNPGSADLRINEIFIPGVFSDEFTIETPGVPATIPPGGSYTITATYMPETVGDDQAVIVVCSNAANVRNNSPTFNCNDESMKPYEICLLGSAINPCLVVEPSEGKLIFRGVLTGDERSDTVLIHNYCEGPLLIESIGMGYGSPDIFIPEEAGIAPPIPAEGFELWPSDPPISVLVKFAPQAIGTHYRGLEIIHSDKDAQKQNGEIGSEYPMYLFEVFGTSGENTQPVAIAKSPPGIPQGPYGTRQIVINLSEETDINLDASESYDNDDDPDTPEVEDMVVEYEWSSPNPEIFTGPTNTAITSASFSETGTYEIQLRVKDSRGLWSNITPIDSKILVTVQKAPIAVAYECETFQSFLTIEAGEQICFDGASSYDEDGTIDNYFWYVEKLGGPRTNFAIGTPQARYTFNEAGTFYVTLTVVDNEGIQSTNIVENEIEIDVTNNQDFRVELSWSGGGDVDLHYIKPNGYQSDFTDCYAGNPSPNWEGAYQCGYPGFLQGSTEGVSPEVATHDDPCDGSYTILAEYVRPAEACEYVTACREYIEDCDRCGCGCYICLGFNCCESCTECGPEWECEDVPAHLTFKLFTGTTSYPTCTVTGGSMILYHLGDTQSFNMARVDGVWICP